MCGSKSRDVIREFCGGHLPDIIMVEMASGECYLLRNPGEIIRPCLPTHAITEPRM